LTTFFLNWHSLISYCKSLSKLYNNNFIDFFHVDSKTKVFKKTWQDIPKHQKDIQISLYSLNTFASKFLFLYVISTWANDHLRIAIPCLQQLPFWSPNLSFYNTKVPLNNDYQKFGIPWVVFACRFYCILLSF